MNIVYVTSTYPSLTETFVSREIEQVIQAGNNVAICILKPFVPETSAKAMCVKDALEIRFTFNVISILISLVRTIITKPASFFKCFTEAIISSIRKPSRAHHIFYLFMSAIWFTHHKELKNIEYVHCHFLHTESIATRWLSVLMNVPYGLSAHIVRIRFDRKLISQVVKSASVCIGDTEETISLLKDLGNTNVTFIRNSIDIDRVEYISPDIRWNSINTPVILATGSLLQMKGFHILISACAQLKKNGYKFQCRIIGEGVERDNLEKQIKELNLKKIVQLPGSVSISELFDEYKRATVFVMPSIPSHAGTDGLPTVIIEAMASGLPVIGTNHAAIPDMVINRETGLIVEPENPESLALAITEIFSAKDLYYKFATKGREKVEREANIRKNNTRLMKVIQAAIIAKS
jgi:glycosyltransferase involved in cell wall biosynthesis